MGIAEAEAEQITEGRLSIALKEARWRSDPATQKQVRILDMYEIDYDEEITKGEASDIIDVLFATAQATR